VTDFCSGKEGYIYSFDARGESETILGIVNIHERVNGNVTRSKRAKRAMIYRVRQRLNRSRADVNDGKAKLTEAYLPV
jgi:hypothetical protein